MYEDDDRRLDAAVSLGIITAEQAAGIRALTPKRRGNEMARPVDASAIGYILGAMTVLIAMGWFLADRWDWLGAGGVLAVVGLYMGLFLVVAQRLRREGFETAGGFATILAVAMVPIAVVAFNELTQWISPEIRAGCRGSRFDVLYDFDLWDCRSLEIVTELATLAAALVAVRAVKFSLFALPIACLALRFVFHGADALFDGTIGAAGKGWLWISAASLMVTAAYVTDRRQPREQDYALWLHLVGGFAAATASAFILSEHEQYRHLMPFAAAVAFLFSLRMRRAVYTLLGLGWFVAYLGWLAADVFQDTPVFPIILAALGLAVIIATVWVQRNSAILVARFGGISSDGRPSFPGGVGLLLLPIVVTIIQLPPAVEVDRANLRINRARMEYFQRQRRTREAAAEASARATAQDSLRALQDSPDAPGDSGQRQETRSPKLP